jgi:DNA-directed RNA polymerase beta' subunit
MEELRQLAAVPTQIISPRECKPIVSVVQDICLGLYRISKSYVQISERQMFNLLTTNNKFNGNLPAPDHTEQGGAKYWSGRQVLSMIFPERLNVEMKSSQFNETKNAEFNKEYVISVRNGQILSGAFDKDVYQSRTKGIVHAVYNEYGPDETRQLYDHTQKLICDWLVYNGFSVGVSDLIVDRATIEEFKEIIVDMKIKVYDIIRSIHDGKFENNSTRNNHEKFENDVNTILNKANKEVGEKGLKDIRDENNRLINMIKSKSKGNTINVAQMIGCVGQQNVDGRRIPYGFEDRTLPHYTKYDDGPESRGFVSNSFIKGLTPQEFFFHAMGGREGLIDTAVQSVTGDTTIIIIEDGMSKHIKIGDWIDGHLAAAKQGDIKLFPDQHNMEYYKFDDTKKVYIPTCDNKGNTSWGELTAITRHDPGAKVFEIKTYSGRSVKVVDTKSLIIWNADKCEFVETKTSDVKIGDCVPTSCYVPETPIINEYVYMDAYFPKDEYVYGTEINRAIIMMNEAQGDNFHIPRGWWEANNGVTFTTPFTSKARLQRMSVRSNTENVKDGCIYPYHAKRDACLMPDKFKLDKEFGIMVGLYIAEGCTDESSGLINIANIDVHVKAFVKQWFGKYNISYREETREMNVGEGVGTTSSIIGYSTIMARFFKKFTGHLAPNKVVPDIAFTAPYEFKIGLLNGYYAGDGSVSKNSVSCSSVSPKLIEGIQMLCSQIGVFGKISIRKQIKNNLGTKNILPTHTLTINAHWAGIFADQVDCILDYKQERLDKISRNRTSHCHMPHYNDIVLDKIIEIKEVDMTDIHKVYDVTVPSTLNFSVASSVLVRDTSETGYIQRKLVKAMEDCKVNYDMSVRNAAGVIVQYLYGEDGMDACKLESQYIPYIDMHPLKIQAFYNLVNGIDDFKDIVSPEILKELEKDKTFIKRMDEHYNMVMTDRDHLIVKVFKGFQESSIMYPVSFHRIITNIQNMYEAAGAAIPYDLSPKYILDTIDALCEELCVTKAYKGNRLMQCLLRAYLSPKRILAYHRLTKNGFDAVIEQIRFRFFESLAQPSEMVGVVAAQSIGEPATQLVLNSVSYDTELLLNNNGILRKVQIGNFIDEIMNQAKKIEDHPNDTKLAWLDDDITILSCDENGKITWQKVEAVTRHPVVNKDGSNTVIKVTTRSGRNVIATKGKSFLIRKDNKITACDGEDLQIGDYLPVSKMLPVKELKHITELDVSLYLSKKEFIFMSDITTGIVLSETHHQYWSKHHGKDFTTPYKRSDTFYDTWISNRRGTTKLTTHKNNCVYPLHTKNHIHISHLPENITLDSEFGFFMGAYLAEGMVCSSGSKEGKNEHHVLIANLDQDFQERFTGFISRFDINFHIDDKFINNGRSITYRIHCMVFAELLCRMCGNGSENKFIPAWVLQAPDEFVKGLIDGYYSGDGSLDYKKKFNRVCVSSVSRKLLEDVRQILVRYGIMSTIYSKNMEKARARVKISYPNRIIQDDFCLHVGGKHAKTFANTFTFTIKKKQAILDHLKTVKVQSCRSDVIPNIVTETYGTLKLNLDKIPHYISKTINKSDQEVFKQILHEDIIYDKVISIEEIPNPTSYVYDLTVENTRTFNLLNGLCSNDTFHSAGISSASQAVRGVPRLNELLSVSKHIKSPIMKIRILNDAKTEKLKCMEIMNNIRTIRFKDVVTGSKIYFDPDDSKTTIEDDKGFIEIYKLFRAETNCLNTSPWLIRLEFDRLKLLEFNIDMITLHHVLDNFYDDNVSCIYSDDNAANLIMRVKLVLKDNTPSDDTLTDLKALEHNIMENVVIKGIKNIERVALALDEKKKQEYNIVTKTFDPSTEWIIYTAGTNIRDVLIHPMVDAVNTMTNDVNEIYETLGIEAARNALFNEIVDVLDSIQVNYRHIALLVDVMTNRGTILSVNRHGINRGDIGPLAKCSFEETTDKLIKAGIFAEYDKINGVSANVMLGQIAPCGTGDVQVAVDEELLEQMVVQEDTLDLDDDDDEDIINKACAEDAFTMTIPEPSKDTNFSRKIDNDIVFAN